MGDRWEGPPEMDPALPLVERLRIASDRGWKVTPNHGAQLMAEAADRIEALTDGLPELPMPASHVLPSGSVLCLRCEYVDVATMADPPDRSHVVLAVACPEHAGGSLW